MAVDFKECLSILESGEWCSLRFITADVKKGSGGQVIDLPKARIARRFIKPTDNLHLNAASYHPGGKDPRHGVHFTRNIELPNKQIRKLHPILITHINQQPVL